MSLKKKKTILVSASVFVVALVGSFVEGFSIPSYLVGVVATLTFLNAAEDTFG